jgi:hypothetical protein
MTWSLVSAPHVSALDGGQPTNDVNNQSFGLQAKELVDLPGAGATANANHRSPVDNLRLVNANKYLVIKAVPTFWDWGLKRFFKFFHDKIDPIPEDEDYVLARRERQRSYDNAYSHLGKPLTVQEILAASSKASKSDNIVP